MQTTRLERDLRELVRAQRPRGRIGLLLSGGVDSALLLALLSEVCEPVCTTAGVPGSADLEYAERAAQRFDAAWERCLLTADALRPRLPRIAADFGTGGVATVASGLLLDVCLERAGDLGVREVYAANGVDQLFGGGSGGAGRFDERFWSDGTEAARIDLYGRLAARHGLKMILPFEGEAAVNVARRADADTDKAPIRALARRLGVPKALASRPKDPLQRSSGTLDVLRELMTVDVERLCPEPFNLAGGDVGLRYFAAFVRERALSRG